MQHTQYRVVHVSMKHLSECTSRCVQKSKRHATTETERFDSVDLMTTDMTLTGNTCNTGGHAGSAFLLRLGVPGRLPVYRADRRGRVRPGCARQEEEHPVALRHEDPAQDGPARHI